MAEETRNFSESKKAGEARVTFKAGEDIRFKGINDYPPITPPPLPNAEEIKQIEQAERRTLMDDAKLGAAASGAAAAMPGVGMGVADLLNNMRSHPDNQTHVETLHVEPLASEEHRDPISGEPGAHPVGVGVGAATGGAAAGVVSGIALGSIGGPVGTAVGAALGAAFGAFAGGWAGKGVAETVHPTVLDVEEHELTRDDNYDDFKAAHAFGWNSRLEYQDETWDAAEEHLKSEWEADSEFHKHRTWNQVRHCVKESWDQADSTRHI